MELSYMLLALSLSGFFGVAVGSFINVWVLRLREGERLLGRSRCPHCKNGLRWYELVPLASFALQGGRCRRCSAELSWQYPLVEALCALGFMLVAWRLVSLAELSASGWLGVAWLVAGWAVVAVSLALAVYDAHAQEVPARWLWYLAAASYAGGAVQQVAVLGEQHVNTALAHALFGGIVVALPLAVLWFLSRGAWLGEADVWVAFSLGSFLGWSQGLSALVLSFWIGTGFVGFTLLAHFLARTTAVFRSFARVVPRPHRGQAIPFLPFLVAALWITLAFDWNVFTIY